MSKKIKDVTESIKSKLSFDDYEPSKPVEVTLKHQEITPSEHKDIKNKKVKRTFYLCEEIVDKLDAFYAKKLSNKSKVDKSDIVTQALKNLLENEDAIVEIF